MKLRILDSSIRLRLSQSEVDGLNTNGVVKSSTQLPGGKEFNYIISKGTQVKGISIEFEGKNLNISCPEGIVKKWAESQQVGFREKIQLENDNQLSILVEKDFKCLDPNREEDESDNFENPLSSKEHNC